ncbi:MAG TPA: transcriptional regulator, partial [Spirochaetes bacterium]|nr:transcriptional regulator [Spirochaetota bacterium]
MKKRSYQQYCPLATGLDIIGQRWTLLIIRELLITPKRYKALLENLPGMGTNLLADRLKSLMTLGIIEQIVQLTPR